MGPLLSQVKRSLRSQVTQIDGRIGEGHAEIVGVGVRDEGVALPRVVGGDVVFVHVELGEIDFEAHPANGLDIVCQALAEGGGLGGFHVALDADGVERNIVCLHFAQEIEDQAAARLIFVAVIFYAVVIVSKPGMRIGSACGAECELDIIRADLLVPEGFAQATGLVVGGKDRFVDDVPGVHAARKMFAYGGDVVDEELARAWTVFWRLNPFGNGVVPTERVAAHDHAIALSKGKQEVGLGEVVLAGRRAECDPLEFASGNDDAALLANQVGELGIVLHVADDDRGTEDQSVTVRVGAERARAGDVMKRTGKSVRAGNAMRATGKERCGGRSSQSCRGF